MRLVVELTEEEYVALDPSAPLVGRLDAVEVCQAGGLLSQDFEAYYVEPLSGAVAHSIGLAGAGPPVRVYIRQKEAP